MTEHIHTFADELSHAGITDIRTYREKHDKVVGDKLHEVSTPTNAEINHGRWIVNCECNGAGFTCPKYKVACCFDCGRVFLNVKFPRDAVKIERLLIGRPMMNRNWQTGETMKTLIAENIEHGCEV
jgi:hypothetical protein